MQPQHRPDSRRHPEAIALARPSDEGLSDWAVASLLGGLYLGGLASGLALLYGLSLIV